VYMSGVKYTFVSVLRLSIHCTLKLSVYMSGVSVYMSGVSVYMSGVSVYMSGVNCGSLRGSFLKYIFMSLLRILSLWSVSLGSVYMNEFRFNCIREFSCGSLHGSFLKYTFVSLVSVVSSWFVSLGPVYMSEFRFRLHP